MEIKLLLEDFCHYAKYIRNVSSQTQARYQQKIGFFIQSTQISKASDITENNVLQFFLHGRVERSWTTRTYLTYYMTLKVFFRWLVANGKMNQNYMDSIEKPKLEKLLPKKLNKQDALKLLEVAYHYPYTQRFLRYRNHAVYATFLFAGLRKSELLNLKLGDVDLENLTLFVHLGKGHKDRIIPISYTLAQSLSRYLEKRNQLNRTCIYFFLSSNRDHRFTENGLKLTNKQLIKASKIHFTTHHLRHTFATLMIEGGCDIFSLSKMMGHSDIKTTTIYLSATAEHLRSQVTKHPLNNLSG